MKLRTVFNNRMQGVFEKFIRWFRSPRDERFSIPCFADSVAKLTFEQPIELLKRSGPADYLYFRVPHAFMPKVPVATTRKFLITLYAVKRGRATGASCDCIGHAWRGARHG